MKVATSICGYIPWLYWNRSNICLINSMCLYVPEVFLPEGGWSLSFQSHTKLTDESAKFRRFTEKNSRWELRTNPAPITENFAQKLAAIQVYSGLLL